MARFLIDENSIKDNVVLLSERESRHALKVLRLKAGEMVELLDGKGKIFPGVVIGAENSRLSVRVGQAIISSVSSVEVTLGAVVIKPERMETLIEKACELGVFSIIPLISERCMVRLSKERWAGKRERWRKIAQGACKQCGQARIPEIESVRDFKTYFEKAPIYDKIIMPTLSIKTSGLLEALKEVGAHGHEPLLPGKVLVLVGPEGDFTKKEVELAVSCGAKAVSLGPITLRSETACLYALSVLNFFYREVIPA